MIPGAVDAWCQLNQDFGTLSLSELLKPAINYAVGGYPIGSRVAFDFASEKDLVIANENLKKVFMSRGRIPSVGEMHHQPELAESLKKITKYGRDAFYAGEIAEDIVSYLQSKGGLHTLEDFKKYSGLYVSPISTEFRGYTVHECPPNGQGIIALMLINMMSNISPGDLQKNSLEHYHLEIEAAKLAYNERDLYLADPLHSNVPESHLLSSQHAKNLMERIDPEKAAVGFSKVDSPSHSDTVYISVIDKDRNCCSFINTLFGGFGSGLMAPKSGVILTNRGQGFVLDPAHPNCIAPNKRPMHTIIPGLVSKDKKVVMSFGVMGGHYQAFGHMSLLTRFLDYDMDIQESQDSPRLFPDPESRLLEVESGIPKDIVDGLRAKGHILESASKPIGGSQAIWIDWDQGILTAGSDPRKDGCAIGY